MKKIDSIHFGGRFIWLMLIFMVIIPVVLGCVNIFLKSSIIISLIIVSFIAGALIGLIFLIILAIELRQDRNLNKKYAAMKSVKIFLENNRFECANCGNIHVTNDDKVCKVCGQIFETTNNKI